jgi:hypothetical protein
MPGMRRSLGFLLATALVLLTAPAASARSYVQDDSLEDTVAVSDSQSPPVRGRFEGDILDSGVVYSKTRVSMAMRFQKLTASGEGKVFTFRIGSAHRVRVVDLTTGDDNWQGTATMRTDRYKKVTCSGIRRVVDYSQPERLVRVSVPSRCLGRPKRVHVGMYATQLADPILYVDDAETNGYIGHQPKWGPWVKRG